jgi:uncharacterized protein (TIGR03118 family)
MSRIPCTLALLVASGCSMADEVVVENGEVGGAAATVGYRKRNLVADTAELANRVDPILVNAWGIATGEGGFWIAAEDTGKVAIYDGAGRPSSGEYVSGALDLGEGITGVVANTTEKFLVSSATECKPAQFIFATIPGQIIGVNADLKSDGGFVMVDRRGKAAYFGVAIALANKTEPRLYAADFLGGRIDVFDGNMKALDLRDAFVDPDLDPDFAPFNVMAVGERVFVMYAEREITDEGPEEMPGPGLGAVNMFDVDGKLLRRFSANGMLNAPWGLALAPPTFGVLGNHILVGNFGDGTINAFDAGSGRFVGQLPNRVGKPLVIDGLWGITFGDGDEAGKRNVLYYAAGPDDEAHGVFGRIQPAGVPPHPTMVAPHAELSTGAFDL